MKFKTLSALLIVFAMLSFVACSNENNEIAKEENVDIDPKLEQFSADEIDNMTATDLLEIELNTELEQRTVTLKDDDGNSMELLIASENLNSIAAYMLTRDLGLNGTAQNLNPADYNLPTDSPVKSAKVYVEFLQKESVLNEGAMTLSVQVNPAEGGAGQRYDETDVYTSGTFIEGFTFTNQYFGPPISVTRMKVTHENKPSRWRSWWTVSTQIVNPGATVSECEDGRRTRATIEHNSGQSDLYNFQFDNCS